MTAAALPELIVITDPNLSADAFLEWMGPVLRLGNRVGVQVRLPGASGREVYEYSKKLHATGNPIFVNGRIDVALALGTHVHLPVEAPRPREIRSLFPARWISAAVHDVDEARAATGADLALISPAFRPTSKPHDSRAPLGPEGVARIAESLSCPVLALGGVNVDNVALLRGLVQGVAVIGGVLHAPDPEAAARALLRSLRAE